MLTVKQQVVFLELIFLSATAQAGIIDDLVGGIDLAPVSITLDTPDAATNIDGTLYVVGSHGGQAARQLVDLTSGIVGTVELFDSLASAAGGTGDTKGKIREVREITGGDVLYVGDSAGMVSVQQPTSWIIPNDPQGGVGAVGTQVDGSYFGVSDNGTLVGTTDDAVSGTHSNLPQLLPGGLSAVVAVDITHDSNFIAGSFLWESNILGGYDVLGTSGFDFTTSGGTPTWKGVATDPIAGDAIFAGEYFSLTTFTNETGFWREDGSFLFSSGSNTNFTDFEVYEGQLVAAVNGSDDSTIFAISDGSSLSLETILGSKTLLVDDGLFVGSMGFLGEDSGGNYFATTVNTTPASADFDEDGDVDGLDFLIWQRGDTSNQFADFELWETQFGSMVPSPLTAVGIPEPSSCVLLLIGVLVGYRRRGN